MTYLWLKWPLLKLREEASWRNWSYNTTCVHSSGTVQVKDSFVGPWTETVHHSLHLASHSSLAWWFVSISRRSMVVSHHWLCEGYILVNLKVSVEPCSLILIHVQLQSLARDHWAAHPPSVGILKWNGKIWLRSPGRFVNISAQSHLVSLYRVALKIWKKGAMLWIGTSNSWLICFASRIDIIDWSEIAKFKYKLESYSQVKQDLD